MACNGGRQGPRLRHYYVRGRSSHWYLHRSGSGAANRMRMEVWSDHVCADSSTEYVGTMTVGGRTRGVVRGVFDRLNDRGKGMLQYCYGVSKSQCWLFNRGHYVYPILDNLEQSKVVPVRSWCVVRWMERGSEASSQV